MSSNLDKIKDSLLQLGVGEDASAIFVHLKQKGVDSALGISKAVKIPRTRVYRNLEKLRELNLVVETRGDSGARFRATGIQQIEMLIAEEEARLAEMKRRIPELANYFESLNLKPGFSGVQVNYYQGVEGLKQINWNSLQTKDGVRIFEIADMSAFMDYKFAEKMREEFVLRNIHIKQITNELELSDWTDVQLAPKMLEVRHVDPEKLKIDFEIIIYSDVVAMYTYRGSEIAGVEIISPALAAMQKQMFDFVWGFGKPLEFVNERGAAKLKLSSQ